MFHIPEYARSAPSVAWRGFPLRALTFISSPETPALIHRFIAGRWMLKAPGCGNRSVLAATLCSPLRAAHARSLAQIVGEFPSPRPDWLLHRQMMPLVSRSLVSRVRASLPWPIRLLRV
jgi:hypothetical protein